MRIRNGSLSEDTGGTPPPSIPRSIPGVFDSAHLIEGR